MSLNGWWVAALITVDLLVSVEPALAFQSDVDPILQATVGPPGSLSSDSCPFVLVAMGQSNMEGYDSEGSKAVQPAIFISNSLLNPTAFVPAAFGVAPLNKGNVVKDGGSIVVGTVTNEKVAFNNSAIWFSNTLRSERLIAPNQKIIILPNWFAGESMGRWVGSGTSSPNWVHLQAHLALLELKYPKCKIDHVIWDQGEADSTKVTTGYSTEVKYWLGLQTLIAQLKALPQWENPSANPGVRHSNYRTSMSLISLAVWPDNWNRNARNDVILLYSNGQIEPCIDVVATAGLMESVDHPGPHYAGTALQTIGARSAENWRDLSSPTSNCRTRGAAAR